MSLKHLYLFVAISATTVLALGCESASLSDERPVADAAEENESTLVSADLVDQGRGIAERNCAVCHAIEATGESPRVEAPPLRSVLADFDIEALAIDFREHIGLGNEIMPEFDFGPLGTDALMAYLLSIEEISSPE